MITVTSCKKEGCSDLDRLSTLRIYLVDKNTGEPLLDNTGRYHPDSIRVFYWENGISSEDDFGILPKENKKGAEIDKEYTCTRNNNQLPNRKYLLYLNQADTDTFYVRCVDKPAPSCGAIRTFYYNGMQVAVTDTDTAGFNSITVKK
jgi:hypothetical protein